MAEHLGDTEFDPITSKSLSFPYLIAALLLMGSLGWALYDEYFGTRPWKDYQHRFVAIYSEWLKKNLPRQADAQKAIENSETYKQLDAAYDAAEKAAAPAYERINKDLANLALRKSVIDDLFQSARGEVNAKTYAWEAGGASDTAARVDAFKKKLAPFKAKAPKEDGSGTEEVNYASFEDLEKEYNRLKDRKNELLSEQAGVLRPSSELRAKRDTYMAEQLGGLNRQQMQGLIDKMNRFDYDIKQINVPEGNLVDRCESCHVGIREPVTLTRRDVGPLSKDLKSGVEDGSRAFTTHPSAELLKIHDPEKFGCSPCHGGNGRATSSVEKGHGKNRFWLWPMYAPANREAGCNQCHSQDLVIHNAAILSQGKELYRWRGCMGCHRMEGFDSEPEKLFTANQTIKQLEQDKAEAFRQAARLEAGADKAASGAAAARMNQNAENMRVSQSRVDARIEQLDTQAKNLLQEVKKVGPSLKEVKMKLRKEWIPVWIKDPQAFRPGAKMPKFRLLPEEVQAISAYIWQSGVTGPIEKAAAGDPARGQDLFETRGCMACHSMGEDADKVGGYFAANLTRVGEKTNLDYLNRWIHNPRQRTLPYSPTMKRDVTPADYQSKGMPFVFDLDHSKSPLDGHEMQVQQQTIMPSLRLNPQEVRDIASFLMTKRRPDSDKYYKPADYMDDPKLKARGAALVRNYGCAGCHEIAGMEDEGRIGTELTNEGSKPIERLDFALLTRDAEEGVDPLKINKEGVPWDNHKGFFEHKLTQPDIYDHGKVKAHLDELKMPNFGLQKNEVRALTTFLLGAVDSTMPPSFHYKPADQRHDIQEGWWIIKKYNCQGCHVVDIGQRSIVMDLPKYQSPDWKEQLPPRITSEGARVSPEWLVQFLKNPSMSEKETDRNGVRPYLKIRMPTFFLSDNEVRKLVRFFEAVSYQPQPYIQAKLDPLTPAEQAMARALFTSKEAPCLKCHATGNPQHDNARPGYQGATAPNFLLAKERLKPGWTGRWLLDPARISPGTSMPSGLFKQLGERYVFNGAVPSSMADYHGDHAQLLVRYMFQMTPDEQRRLGSGGAGGGGGGGAGAGGTK